MFSDRYLLREGEKEYRSLCDYTNKELIYFLECNMTIDLKMLTGIMSEILRRMNQIQPLLRENDDDKKE